MYRKNFNNRGRFGKRKFNGGGRYGSNSRKYTAKSINIESFISKVESEPEQSEYIVKNTYADFAISPILKQNVLAKGFTVPTAIQDQAIPHILEGKDLIGLANTGTGKTAAYIIPLINKVLANKKEKVLVIAPTRELATQISTEFRSLKNKLAIYSVVLTGGSNIYRQISELRRDHNFLIVTPGRLKDLIKRNQVNISTINTLVLDEVDRMFDMGFIKEVKYFMSLLPKKRQSLFFSATSSAKIEQLIRENSSNPVKIDVLRGTTAGNVSQNIVKYETEEKKVDVLHDLLIQQEFKKVLIFGRTKSGVDKLSKELRNRGFKADEIHGNKRQNARTKSLTLFRESKVNILVATDVASRGIDVVDITHVINYDLPETYDDYVHRVGRTGRANRQGQALSFVRG